MHLFLAEKIKMNQMQLGGKGLIIIPGWGKAEWVWSGGLEKV
jgi:hypothetical protein